MIKAKDYLSQLKKLDRLIENKLIEREQWRSIATGTTAQMGGERVQSSSDQQKMASAVSRYIDIEKEIDEAVDKLIDAKKEIISLIEELDATEYDILHKIYVQYIPIYELPDILDKSYSCITTAHGRALKNVQRILDERKITGV